MTRVAVVTVVHGRHDHLRRQHESLARLGAAHVDHVVVAMDDPDLAGWSTTSPPHPHVVAVEAGGDGLPLAAARNLGARTALRRGADLLVFLDVDCLAGPALLTAYREASRTPTGRGALMCGPVTYLPPPPEGGYDLAGLAGLAAPHTSRPAPPPGEVVRDEEGHRLFWSLSFASTAATWDRVGGFDEGYVGYGAEDTDVGQRAASAGVPLAWVGGADAFHQYHPTSDPPVQHVEDIVRNGRRFRERWGWWPMQGWLDAFVERGLVRQDAEGSYHLIVSGPHVPRSSP